MKKLLVLLALVVVWAVYQYCRLPNVVRRVRSSVVYVQVRGKSGQLWSGSGAVIGDGLILTARHVIHDANDVCITFDDGTKVRSSKFFELKMDGIVVDVGLIIVGNTDDYLYITQFEPVPGARVFTVGSPFGLQNSVTVGVFSKYDVCIGNERLYQLDINGNPGMSGCPVFNRYGMVIGILVRGHVGGLALIVPARTCQAVINIYENVRKITNK